MGDRRRRSRRGTLDRTAVLASLLALVASLVAASTAGAQDAPESAESSFTDVEGHWALDHIVGLEDEGTFDGTECGEAMFCPSTPLKRETMAVWMVRVLDGSDPAPATNTRFSDVDGSHQWTAHIERFAELGVTKGYTDGTFRPDVTVSRAHMASFLARAFDLPAAEPKGFGDVEGSGHEDNINRIAAVGITVGCGGGTNYCPSQQTSRAEMAVFISRALKYVDSEKAAPVTGDLPTLAVGFGHTCTVRTDSTMACWGRNTSGQAEAPGGTFKSVAIGPHHSCGLRTDGAVLCWGSNHHGKSVPPAGTFKAMPTRCLSPVAYEATATLPAGATTKTGKRTHPAVNSRPSPWGTAMRAESALTTPSRAGATTKKGKRTHPAVTSRPLLPATITPVGSAPATSSPAGGPTTADGTGTADKPVHLRGPSRPMAAGRHSHLWDPHRRQGRLLGALQVRQVEPPGGTFKTVVATDYDSCGPHQRHDCVLEPERARQSPSQRHLQDQFDITRPALAQCAPTTLSSVGEETATARRWCRGCPSPRSPPAAILPASRVGCAPTAPSTVGETAPSMRPRRPQAPSRPSAPASTTRAGCAPTDGLLAGA